MEPFQQIISDLPEPFRQKRSELPEPLIPLFTSFYILLVTYRFDHLSIVFISSQLLIGYIKLIL